MAVISPNTFDPLRRYVGVRLQQGVPIVDADWNELEDVRKFELRAFLKWFIGDGIPEGNDGFRIVGQGNADDFRIEAGVSSGSPDGLHNVGRCLVDGLDVMITVPLNFTDQPLHQGQAGAAQLASDWGVSQIQSLSAFPTGTVLVYLDVWERLVTVTEDPSLVHAGLGVESAVRLRREWAVRVRSGSSVPVAGDSDYLPGHSYYALAAIQRQSASVEAGDVTDLREQRLLLPPATLIDDLFGLAATDYRRGQGRPPISFRQAINALLRGEVPATPEVAVAPAAGADDEIGRGTFFDGAGGLVTSWNSDRVGGTMQIFVSRLALAAPGAGFTTPPQRLTGGVAHLRPHAAALDNGQMLVVYESITAPGNEDIHLKVGQFSSLTPAAPEIVVAADAGIRQRAPFAVPVGGQVLVFWHESPGNIWQFNRFDLASGAFPGAKANLSAVTASAPSNPFQIHAARDSANNTWVAFRTTAGNIRTLRIPPVGGPDLDIEHDSGFQDNSPFVLVDQNDVTWIFWNANPPGGGPNPHIWYRRYVQASDTWDMATPVPGTDTSGWVVSPAATFSQDGTIWLFCSGTPSGNQDIMYILRHPVTGVWGELRQITGTSEADNFPSALHDSAGVIWLFWNRQFGANGEIFYRRIITSI